MPQIVFAGLARGGGPGWGLPGFAGAGRGVALATTLRRSPVRWFHRSRPGAMVTGNRGYALPGQTGQTAGKTVKVRLTKLLFEIPLWQ